MTLRRAAVLILTVLPAGGCGEGNGLKEGFDKGFDRGARESFVKSCVAQVTKVDTQTATALCGCMSDYMSRRLSRAEMLNPVSERASKVEDEAVEACIAQLAPGPGK